MYNHEQVTIMKRLESGKLVYASVQLHDYSN